MDIGLTEDTEFHYRVRAFNLKTFGDYSNILVVKTLMSIPRSPSFLFAQAIGTSEIYLRWMDSSYNETGFKIERKLGAEGVYTDIAVVGANITYYTDAGLNDNTVYYYRVKSYNLTGESDYSNEAHAITLLGVPRPPADLISTTLSASEISLEWRDNSWNEAGFRIERKKGVQGIYTEIAIIGANITNYIDTGLEDYTEYFYRVKSYNAAGESGYSNESTSKTFLTILSVPSNLTADSIGVYSIGLKWINNSTSTVGYRIERQLGVTGNYSEIGVINENRTFYLDNTLKENTEYHYRVRAYNSKTISDYSNILVVKTLMSIPRSPNFLLVQALSTSEIYLSWTDSSYNEAGFRIERKQGNSGVYVFISRVKENDTTFIDKGLDDDTEYFYRVKSYNLEGESDYSNVSNAKTFLAIPNPPEYLIATARSETEIELNWMDNSAKETGFKIERKLGIEGSFSEIDSVSQNVTSYLDQALEDSTEYYYRIKSYNLAGESEYSNESSAITYLAIPLPPSELQAKSISASAVELYWQDNSTKENGFKIERSFGTKDNYEEIVILAENECSYVDEGLLDNTEYFYRVRSFNTAGVSVYSNESSARTKLVLPSTPIDLIAVLPSCSIIRLEWQDSSRSTEGFKIELSINTVDYFREYATVYKPYTSYIDSIFSIPGVYFFRIKAFNELGYSDYSNIASVVLSSQKDDLIPTEFRLYQNYPNPFNPSTTIDYSVPQSSNVRIEVYDLLGRLIATPADELKSPGKYQVKFNANHLSAGVYLYRMRAGNFVEMRKMTLLK